MNHLLRALDSVDACIFSGDSLEDASNRQEIKTHIAITAMQGMLANSNFDYAPLIETNRKAIIEEAWRLADEMIAHGQATAMPTQRG